MQTMKMAPTLPVIAINAGCGNASVNGSTISVSNAANWRKDAPTGAA
jgi:hypothetical protein